MGKIIVLVDVQNDFIKGKLGDYDCEVAVRKMEKCLKALDSPENIVLFTKDTHDKTYPRTKEGKWLPIPHCIQGTGGWSIDKRISHLVDKGSFAKLSAKDIIKGRILKDTFGSRRLMKEIEVILNSNFPVDEIIFMGFKTDICVISNVLMCKSFFPEMNITVCGNCCAGTTSDKHYDALGIMDSCHINLAKWEEDKNDFYYSNTPN